MTREEQLAWLQGRTTEIYAAHDAFLHTYRQLPNTIYLPFPVQTGTEVIGLKAKQAGFFMTREDEEGRTSLFGGLHQPLLSEVEERLGEDEDDELLEWLDGQAKLWQKLAKKNKSVLLFDPEKARDMTEKVAARLRRS